MARSSSKNTDFVGIAMAVLGILGGFLIPVSWWQASVPTVLLVALAGFVFGGCTFMFAKGRLQILLFFAVFSAVLLWIRGFQNILDGTGGIGLTWFMYVISGTIIGANYRPDKKKQMKRKASGALLVQWKDGSKVFEDEAPSAASLEEHVKSLDGKKRALVSAMRGTARMDFCGDGRGAMVVYFSPNTSDDKLWSMMTTPGAEEGQTEVVVGDLEGSFENWETTRMESAVIAARHFASTGQEDPTLTWHASKDVSERRPLAS
jgi:hypothetical protein